MIQGLFNLITVAPLVIWISMILFPKTLFTQRMIMSYWIYMIFGALYAILGLAFLASELNVTGLDLNSLQQMLSSDWGLLALWTHIMSFNLFIGVWIFRDAKYWGIKTLPYLMLSFLAAPLGLAVYLFIRQRKSKKDPIRTLN